MKHKSIEYQQARDLFYQTDKTQQEIAGILHIDRKTLGTWIKEGQWTRMKQVIKQSPSYILYDIYNHVHAINAKILARDPAEQDPTMEEVNKLGKLLRMTRYVDVKTTPIYIEVMEELLQFYLHEDPADRRRVTEVADRFIHATLPFSQEIEDRRRRENIVATFRENLANHDKLNSSLEGGGRFSRTEGVAEPSTVAQSGRQPENVADDSTNTQSTPEPTNNANSLSTCGEGWGEVIGEQCGDNGEMSPTTSNPTEPLPTASHEAITNENFPAKLPKKNISEHGELENNSSLKKSSLQGGVRLRRTEGVVENSTTAQSSTSPLERGQEDVAGNSTVAQSEPSHTPNSQLQIPDTMAPAHTAAYYCTLPRSRRPSPFREGDNVWVNSIFDLDVAMHQWHRNPGVPTHKYWQQQFIGDKICRYPDHPDDKQAA